MKRKNHFSYLWIVGSLLLIYLISIFIAGREIPSGIEIRGVQAKTMTTDLFGDGKQITGIDFTVLLKFDENVETFDAPVGVDIGFSPELTEVMRTNGTAARLIQPAPTEEGKVFPLHIVRTFTAGDLTGRDLDEEFQPMRLTVRVHYKGKVYSQKVDCNLCGTMF